MRIGIYARQFDPKAGGGHSFQAQILNCIKPLEGKHTFFLFHDSTLKSKPESRLPLIPYDGHEESLSFNVQNKLKATLQHKHLKSLSPLDRAAKEQGIDLVWFLSPLIQKVSLPYIYTLWDLQHRTQPFFPEVSVTGWDWDARENYYRYALPRAFKVITGTFVGKGEIERFYGVCPDNVKVIPFPVIESSPELSTVNVCEKYSLKRPYLFYPAQFWPHKNHINILLALSSLRQEGGSSFDMVFAGSDKGNETFVRQKAEELGLSQYVHFLGFVPEDVLTALYCDAFALLFASFFGPDNLPPLEAFELGCPVIASRIPGAEEQLQDAALLFNPTDVHELANAIKRLENDPDLRATLVRKGRDLATWRPRDYLNEIIKELDAFELIKRCWGSDYRQI